MDGVEGPRAEGAVPSGNATGARSPHLQRIAILHPSRSPHFVFDKLPSDRCAAWPDVSPPPCVCCPPRPLLVHAWPLSTRPLPLSMPRCSMPPLFLCVSPLSRRSRTVPWRGEGRGGEWRGGETFLFPPPPVRQRRGVCSVLLTGRAAAPATCLVDEIPSSAVCQAQHLHYGSQQLTAYLHSYSAAPCCTA